VIRLPIGSKTKMVIAVADLDGTIIGLRRMTDSTQFSIGVAVTKARNMVYFNCASRTAGDLNQVPLGTAVPTVPLASGHSHSFLPGVDGSSPGPFYNLHTQDVANPCSQGFQSGPPNTTIKASSYFFPGAWAVQERCACWRARREWRRCGSE